MASEKIEKEYIIHTKPGCTFCLKSKRLLEEKKLTYKTVDHDTPEDWKEFLSKVEEKSYPQIYLGEKKIGGFKELVEHLCFLYPDDDF